MICAVLLSEMRTPLAVSALVLCTRMVIALRPSLLHVSKTQNWNRHLPMMMRVPRHPEMIAASLGGETMILPMAGGENRRARGEAVRAVGGIAAKGGAFGIVFLLKLVG